MEPNNPKIYLLKAWVNVFPETKTNEEKEILKDILSKEILSRKRQRKRDFTKVVMLWIFTFSYNAAIAFFR